MSHLLISASAFSQLTDFLYKAVGLAQAIGILPYARREFEIVKKARLVQFYYLDSLLIHSFLMSSARQLDHHDQYYIKSGDLYIIVC